MIKAVVFDMDGVLVDARDWHFNALNRSLNSFGFNISRKEHLSVFDGLTTSQKLTKLTELKNLPVSLHLIINKLKQRFTEVEIVNNCCPEYNIQYAIKMLKRDNIPTVASNSIRKSVNLMLEKIRYIRII